MAVLAFWLPVTNHCRLELIPGLEFIACCAHSEEEQSSAHHENECAEDLCAQVEEGLYKTESSRVIVEAPAAGDLGFLPVPLELSPSPEQACSLSRLGTSPPEISRTWQFSFRAAAPPRAPSLVS